MNNNPSLREQPRHLPAGVIPLQQEPSILDWLQRTGRLLERDSSDPGYLDVEEDISELMSGDESGFDDDDDDDDGAGLEDDL